MRCSGKGTRRGFAIAKLAFLLLSNSAVMDQFLDKLLSLDQPILKPQLSEAFPDFFVDYM